MTNHIYINVLQANAYITTVVNEKRKTKLLVQHVSTRFIITRNTKHFKQHFSFNMRMAKPELDFKWQKHTFLENTKFH